jgi:hypothetical protein
MIFVITYNRDSGEIVALNEFDDSRQEDASASRLAAETALGPGDEAVEVVTLRAQDLQEIQKTHSRYFRSAKQLSESLRTR